LIEVFFTVVFLSQSSFHWMTDLCCEHGIPRRDLAADVAIPIAQNAFAELQLLYGGGPLVMSDTKQNADACAACAEQVRKAAREEVCSDRLIFF
jgi:hypothetical protein